MIDPVPELPDDTLIAHLKLPPIVQQALATADLRTVGEVREAPDAKILRIPELGESLLPLLRQILGLPSSIGVRCDAAPTRARDGH